jgi:hypothetical protein
MSSDHGVRTNVDVSLVENRGLWKTDNAVLSKGTETLPSRGVRTDGSVE